MNHSVEYIRESFKNYHLKDGYSEEHHVRMDNDAFPHTFNASGLETQIKELIDELNNTGGIHPIEKKLFCIQPCFRRFDIENIDKNGYSIFFQMCGKVHFTPNLKEELPNYFQKHLDFFTKEFKIDQKRLRFTIFGGGKIAKIGETEMPEDTRSREMLLNLGIPAEKIISIYNAPEKGEIDNFLVRFERLREQYSGYGIDIYYDLGTEKQHGDDDKIPGKVKGGRFLELSTTRICDLWRTSGYGEAVKLVDSPLPCVVSALSLERLAFILQNVSSIFEIDMYRPIFATIQTYGFSQLQTKKLIALLVPLYYIISEGNLPARIGGNKRGDLRLLVRNVFQIIDEGDNLERLRYLFLNRKILNMRKERFQQLGLKQRLFFFEIYDYVLKLFNPTYNTLESKYKHILEIIANEKQIYLEPLYKHYAKQKDSTIEATKNETNK